MATQTRLFLGLIRPPKLIGLPIMYAMVWLFGFVLLFLWVQSWPVIIIRRSGLSRSLESGGLGSSVS